MRAITLYCDLVADCVLDGLQAELLSTGVDIGEGEVAPVEALPEAEGESAVAPAAEAAAPAAEATEPAADAAAPAAAEENA